MRDNTERGRDIGREKQAPCWEPDVGLDPRTPGSRPGLKAGTKPLSHQGFPPNSPSLRSIIISVDECQY